MIKPGELAGWEARPAVSVFTFALKVGVISSEKLLGQLKQARRVLEKSAQLKASKSLLRHEVVAQWSALAMADCFVAERNRRSPDQKELQ